METYKKYFSIGEMAKLNKVTIKALHYYHDIGLLIPVRIDSDFIKIPSGYFLTYPFSEGELKEHIEADFVLTFELYTDFFNEDNSRFQAQVYTEKNLPKH